MSSSPTHSLPPTMRALVCETKGTPMTLQTIPTPTPTPGAIIVQVLASTLDASLPNHLSGSFFTFPSPFVPGPRCVGRIAATSQDTTTLQQGQLVLVDPFLRARDDPNIQALFGIFDGPTPTSRTWFATNWRNGTFAEYVSCPLENVHPLNESILVTQLNYTIPDLLYLQMQVLAYGGLRSISLQAGETVIIAPATGGFSGAAVSVAVAMGATVIAASRNIDSLKQIQSRFPTGRVHVVQLTNDVEKDTANLTSFGKPVDAYIDISPPGANGTTHVRSCFNALKQYGRATLMGALQQDVAVSYMVAVFKNLTVRGQYMYERSDVVGTIRLAEAGMLKLGKDIGAQVVGEYGLEEIDDAIECANTHTGYGMTTALMPQKK